MPPKSKVETSPHFEEIVNLLLQGESGRKVSAYLKKEYNEDIGFNAINNYRRKHIKLEEKVLHEVDKRLAEKAKKNKKTKKVKKSKKSTPKKDLQKEHVKELSEKVAIEKVDQSERIEQASQNVVNATAEQVQGLLNVGADFEENYKAMKHLVYDPTSKVTQKDVTEMSLKANKLYLDFIKSQESNVEVNIENNRGLSELFCEEDILRFIYESEIDENSS